MDQHQLYENDPFYYDFSSSQYLMGSLLTRVYYAGLENNIKAIIWYNGEDECGSPNPEAGIYTSEFAGLYHSCKDYLGSFKQMYVVQVASYVGPLVGIGFVSEDQRTLPLVYDKLKVMSSNGIGSKSPAPNQSIHFTAAAYEELGRRLFNLVQKDMYEGGTTLNPPPPDILKVRTEGNRIYLDFDQLLDTLLSDPLDIVLSVIRFNIPDVPKYNPGIDGNSFYFDVDPAFIPMILEVSYAGYLPNGLYDLKSYLRNSENVAALTFYKMPITNGGNPYGVIAANTPPPELTLYPNPVKGIARISYERASGETCIQLFNTTGRLIKQQFETGKTFDLDFSTIPAGIYYLRLSTSNGIQCRKVVVL